MTNNINEFITRHLGACVEIKWETRAQTPKCKSYYFGGTLFVDDWEVIPEKVVFKGVWELGSWYEEACFCGECREEVDRLIRPLRRTPVEVDQFGYIFVAEINRVLMEPRIDLWDAGLASQRADVFTWISPLTRVTVLLTPAH